MGWDRPDSGWLRPKATWSRPSSSFHPNLSRDHSEFGRTHPRVGQLGVSFLFAQNPISLAASAPKALETTGTLGQVDPNFGRDHPKLGRSHITFGRHPPSSMLDAHRHHLVEASPHSAEPAHTRFQPAGDPFILIRMSGSLTPRNRTATPLLGDIEARRGFAHRITSAWWPLLHDVRQVWRSAPPHVARAGCRCLLRGMPAQNGRIHPTCG